MAWTVPKTWVAGEIVDEAELNSHLRNNLNYLNDSRIAYAQQTTATGSIGATQTIILSAPAFTPISGSRIIRITARWRSWTCTVLDDIFAFRIMEFGVGQKNERLQRNQSATFEHDGGEITALVPSPSASSHTYNLSADRVTGTGTMIIQAASTYPIQIWVEDVGAA